MKANELKDLKAKVLAIQEDKSKAILLVDIIGMLSKQEANLMKVIHGLSKALSHVIKREDFVSKNAKYVTWLHQVYDEAWQRLLTFTTQVEEKRLCELAITTLMHFLVTKHEHSGLDSQNKSWSGEDHKRFKSLLTKLCCSTKDIAPALDRFKEYWDYDDVKAATINHLTKIVKSLRKDSDRNEKNTPHFGRNVMKILESVGFPDPNSEESKILMGANNLDMEEVKKSFNNIWQDFFWLISKDIDVYKRVLIILHDKVMPHLAKPLLLTDFLMESYDVGGSISLLALSGVFHLIEKYNLEYPDFYKKLYALFTPDVLHVKYRARFFHLSDLFLASSHLPEYLVAAFVKRLCRLSLTAPANTLVMVMQFIGNLLLRHPGLQKMAKNTEDPYDMEEPDPAKCKAIESSLWEIATLQSHVLPQVSQAAKFINKLQPQMEWTISAQLEHSFEDMMETELKKKVFVNVPLTFERPNEKLDNSTLFE